MGRLQRIVDAVFGREPSNDAEFSPALMEAILQGGASGASWKKAIEVSAVLAVARIKATDLASSPWKIMKDDADGNKHEAKEHPYHGMITWEPNPWQTSYEMRQTIGFHIALAGNAYVWLDRVTPNTGKIVGLLPLEPGWVSVKRSSSDWTKLEYTVRFPDGTMVVTDNRHIWHLRDLSWNTYKGLDALSYARKAIGLAQDIENSQSSTHKTSARPSGVLAVDQTLDTKQFAVLRALVDAQVRERLSKGYPMVIDKTMTWTQLAAKSTDMQSVESKKQVVEDIAIQMGMLPAMIGYGDGSQSYASVEQLFIRHLVQVKHPALTNFMQSSDRWLLSARERRAGFYNHVVDQAMLRGDIKARGEFYRLMWMIGALTQNEIRRFEDMNPIDGLDRPWAPLANAPIGEDGMPMIADNRTDIDKALQDADATKALGDALRQAGPSARAAFIAHLQSTVGNPEAE